MTELSWKEKLSYWRVCFWDPGHFHICRTDCSWMWRVVSLRIPCSISTPRFPRSCWDVKGGLTLLGVYMVVFPILKLMLRKTAWGETDVEENGNRQRRWKLVIRIGMVWRMVVWWRWGGGDFPEAAAALAAAEAADRGKASVFDTL